MDAEERARLWDRGGGLQDVRDLLDATAERRAKASEAVCEALDAWYHTRSGFSRELAAITFLDRWGDWLELRAALAATATKGE